MMTRVRRAGWRGGRWLTALVVMLFATVGNTAGLWAEEGSGEESSTVLRFETLQVEVVSRGVLITYEIAEAQGDVLPVRMRLDVGPDEVASEGMEFELGDLRGEVYWELEANRPGTQLWMTRVSPDDLRLARGEAESGEALSLVIPIEMIRARPVLERPESLAIGSETARRHAREEVEDLGDSEAVDDAGYLRGRHIYDVLELRPRRSGRRGEERSRGRSSGEEGDRIEEIERDQERRLERYRPGRRRR